MSLVPEEGAQGAVFGLGAGVDVQTAAGEKADAVVPAVEGLDRDALGADPAADAQAGIGAGDVEEAFPDRRADADVLHRGRLLHGQVGSLRAGGRAETGGRSEKACRECHEQVLPTGRPSAGPRMWQHRSMTVAGEA